MVGGSETLAFSVAQHLRKFFEVEVLTTCAKDYHSWRNVYSEGVDVIDGIPVRRFKVESTRDLGKFVEYQDRIFSNPHTVKEELTWLDMQGPYVPRLIEYIDRKKADYDCFIFFSYRYYHSYHGVKVIPEKSILVPTAEDDLALNLNIFRNLFHLPKCIVYLTEEEKRLVQNKFQNQDILNEVIATGITPPSTIDGETFRQKYGISGDFVLYVGRIDGSKGCYELFDYFKMYREKADTDRLKLVLGGPKFIPIPTSPDVLWLGLPQEDKFSAMKEAAVMIHPSLYESLSIVTLETMSVGTPVLVNGKCEVLKGHTLRSNGGLYYTNYEEFEACLSLLLSDQELRNRLGANAKKYVQENYDWRIVEKRYRALIEKAFCMSLGQSL